MASSTPLTPVIPTTQQEVVFDLRTLVTQSPAILEQIQALPYKGDTRWLHMQEKTRAALQLLREISSLAYNLENYPHGNVDDQ